MSESRESEKFGIEHIIGGLIICFVLLLIFGTMGYARFAHIKFQEKREVSRKAHSERYYELLSLSGELGMVNTEKSSGSFFLITGSYKHESSAQVVKTVKFWFKNHQNEYLYATFLYEDIRLELVDDEDYTPSVRFIMDCDYSTDHIIQGFNWDWKGSVRATVIRINKKHIIGEDTYSIDLNK